MRCVRCAWLFSEEALLSTLPVRAGLVRGGCSSCQAPLEPALDLPGWRLLRAEDEYGACLQVPLLGHVVGATGRGHPGANPALCLLLHAAADTASELIL